MDLRRVIIFRTVVRAGSISSGARALGWTQPAVSQHLRQLERQAGTALLVRGATGVQPTEAGRALLHHADAIAAHLDAAAGQLTDLAAGRTGTVRLAAFPSALAVTVPGALKRMTEHHPDVQVQLTEAEPPDALDLVRHGEVDLALVFGFREQRDDDTLRRIQLAHDPVRLVVPRGSARVQELTELADAAWIAGCERCRGHLVAVCGDAGFTPAIRHVTDDYVVVQSLVALGLAVATLPDTALTAFRHPGVEVVELPQLGSRAIALVHRAGVEQMPAVAAMITALTG